MSANPARLDQSQAAITTLLQGFDIGEVRDTQRASHGIENFNLFVTAEKEGRISEYVLTVLMTQRIEPTYLPLMDTLNQAGLPVAAPLPDAHGERIADLDGQQAILQPRLRGQHTVNPTTRQIEALARYMARMHLAGQSIVEDLADYPRTPDWLQAQHALVNQTLSFNDQALAESSVAKVTALLKRNDVQSLPTGLIHGDLFRDNVLFNPHGLTGVIDFHHAARGFWIYDLAVTANDWCCDASGALNPDRTTALLKAYHQVRPLERAEVWFFPLFALWGALAFWLSRAAGVHRARKEGGQRVKDPQEFRRILASHVRTPFYLDTRLLNL